MNSEEQARALSRHTLSYIMCAISEMLRAYDLSTIDLLIIHAVMNANVVPIMRNRQLDDQFSSVQAVEPDDLKRSVSRSAIARFLNMPTETIRRRVSYLIEKGIIEQKGDGIIITEKNLFRFGNNADLQMTNVVLFKKLMDDLRAADITL